MRERVSVVSETGVAVVERLACKRSLYWLYYIVHRLIEVLVVLTRVIVCALRLVAWTGVAVAERVVCG